MARPSEATVADAVGDLLRVLGSPPSKVQGAEVVLDLGWPNKTRGVIVIEIVDDETGQPYLDPVTGDVAVCRRKFAMGTVYDEVA